MLDIAVRDGESNQEDPYIENCKCLPQALDRPSPHRSLCKCSATNSGEVPM